MCAVHYTGSPYVRDFWSFGPICNNFRIWLLQRPWWVSPMNFFWIPLPHIFICSLTVTKNKFVADRAAGSSNEWIAPMLSTSFLSWKAGGRSHNAGRLAMLSTISYLLWGRVMWQAFAHSFVSRFGWVKPATWVWLSKRGYSCSQDLCQDMQSTFYFTQSCQRQAVKGDEFVGFVYLRYQD